MRRYYLSPVAPTGFHGSYVPVLESAIDAAGLRPAEGQCTAAWMPTDPTAPGAFALVLAELPNHSPLLADGRFEALPDFSLDGKFSSIGLAQRNRLKTKLRDLGFTTAEISEIDGTDAYRESIRAIGNKTQPGFDESRLDVAVRLV